MKMAAGCFGCLAFVFLGVSLFFSFGMSALAQAVPEAAEFFVVAGSLPANISSACCCLSGALAVVLLAVGMMGGKKEESYE
jgi:hypothetical protein